jgi:hypothetical protein
LFAQRFRPIRRRDVVVASALLVILIVLVAGCASNQNEAEKGGAAPVVAGHFVGDATPSTTQHTLVAIAASSPEEGTDKRDVKTYLSDGQQISEWFSGSVTGNNLDLAADDGAQLKGSLAPEAATGTVTLPDTEKSFTFTVTPASGPAGLYNVNIADDGSFVGTSERGGRMEGKLSQQADSQGYYPFAGTITPPDGQPANFNVEANDTSAGEARVIVSDDLHMVGAGKRSGNETALRISG